MGKLPPISGKTAVKAFYKLGWKPVRQTGSHIIMMRENSETTLSIPHHKTLKKGLLRALIKDAGTTVEEFLQKI
jgi:predicted RNA binding protein YcfA (HicA-like mRNA interferase family)